MTGEASDWPRAVIFDLDGTLVHSLPGMTAALHRYFVELGLTPLPYETLLSLVGDGLPAFVERAFALVDVPQPAGAVARLAAIYGQAPAADSHVYPDVAEVLTTLSRSGKRLAICTNKPQALARKLLADLALDRHFSVIVGGDSVGARKPDPAPLLAALEPLGVAAGQAAMVGDGPHDVEAGKRAGAATVVCSYGYSRVPVSGLGADRVIDGMAALPEALATLRPGG
ncbi:MAG: phosphoglycolate phosphatase [Rhodospirillales bacterium]